MTYITGLDSEILGIRNEHRRRYEEAGRRGGNHQVNVLGRGEEQQTVDEDLAAARARIRGRIENGYLEGLAEEVGNMLPEDPEEDDELTALIRNWTVRYETTDYLKELLVDPITGQPFTEDALVGNDGKTYDKRSLTTFLSVVDADRQGISPLDPNCLFFFVKPHPVVPRLVKWLDDRGWRGVRSQDLDDQYEQLKAEGKLIRLPSEAGAEMRRLVAEEERESEELVNRIGQAAREACVAIDEEGERGCIELRDRIDGVREQLLRERREMQRELDEIEQGNRELNEGIEGVREQIERNRQAADALEINIHQVEVQREQVKQNLDARRSGSLGALLAVGLGIAGSAFLTYVLSTAAAGSGVGWQATVRKGTAVLKGSVYF